MSKLSVSICGNTAPDVKPEDNPSYYLGDNLVQEAVLWVAAEFPTRQGLFDRYGSIAASIENLFRVGALREEAGRVLLNFTLFTRNDHRIIRERSDRHAADLAEWILADRQLIEDMLPQLTFNRATMQKTAMIAVGCLALDAGGLQTLAELGYTLPEKRQTGGIFTVSAEEKTELDLRGIYWGCHSDLQAGLSFVSFGDHAVQGRNALPDILWRRPFWVRKEDDTPTYRAMTSGYLDALRNDLAKVVRQLARQDGDVVEATTACPAAVLVDWLDSLGYLDADRRLAVPYFAAEDVAAVRTVKKTVLDKVREWSSANYEDLKANLADVTPMKHGVDFREVMIQVWHWIFGLTNKRLAEAGFFFDTYATGHKSPGCVPAIVEEEVWHA